MELKHRYWKWLNAARDYGRRLDRALKPVYCPLQQWNNKGVYAVNIYGRVGFFAQMSWCTDIFAYAELHRLTPYIELTSPFYTIAPSENWLDYYFDQIVVTDDVRRMVKSREVRVSRISDIDQMGLPPQSGKPMSIEDAHRLINKYLNVKDEIRDYVDTFVSRHFTGHHVIGVHFRGTDKKSEAEPVSRDFCEQTIRKYREKNPQLDRVFAASDDSAFIDWIKSRFTDLDVVSHDDMERSRDGRAIHLVPSVGNNYEKGKEALINCLLLSRCNALIRSASFLSGWSSVFNPSMPVVMMNRPYAEKLWFPDSAIYARSMTEYLAE